MKAFNNVGGIWELADLQLVMFGLSVITQQNLADMAAFLKRHYPLVSVNPFKTYPIKCSVLDDMAMPWYIRDGVSILCVGRNFRITTSAAAAVFKFCSRKVWLI